MKGMRNLSMPKIMTPPKRNLEAIISQNTDKAFGLLPSAMRLPTPAFALPKRWETKTEALSIIIV